ncbi:MAG TPA: hypothetical protein P5533_03740 [Candidatus Cloacimonadota bacterium]|nr:hypothetical protein [Candidatus Cloacimonadota bacterium]
MRCSNAQKLIIPQLDHELNNRKSQKLQQHIRSCYSCQAYQTELCRLNSGLESLSGQDFPAWIHHRILDQADQHDKVRRSSFRLLQLQKVPAFLAILLSLGIGFRVGTKAFDLKTRPETAKVLTANSALVDFTGFGETSIMELVSVPGGGINE